MKNNITELVFILDRSGSMAGLEGDTIGGFNAMIEKQKKQEVTLLQMFLNYLIFILSSANRLFVLCQGLLREVSVCSCFQNMQ